MKTCLFFLAFCLSAPVLLADDYAENTSIAIMFKQLSTTDGLSNNSVRCLFRDSRGFLWIGTRSGLNQYDGYTFRQYYRSNSNLPNDAIQEIFEDPEHNIWVGLAGEYSIYDYATGHFDNNHKQRLDHLQIPSRNVLRVGSAGTGEFWAYDRDKLYLKTMNGGEVKIFPLRKEMQVFNVQVNAQKIFVMYDDKRLYAIDKQTSQTEEVMIPEHYRNLLANRETDVYVGQNGDLWVYTYRNSLLLYKTASSDSWENIRLTSEEDELYNRVQRIWDVGNGRVWILTSHTGLFIYNTSDKSLTNLRHSGTNPNTIASNNLSAVFQDKDGTMWIGNFKHGVSYYSPSSQIIYSYCPPDNEDILTFCEDADNGCIYYGTDGGGLMRIRGTQAPEQVATPANIVVDLSLDARHRLWMGTYQKGLICWSEQGGLRQYTMANSDLLDDNVYAVEADRNGYVWIGTMGGHIQRLNPTTGEFQTILNRPVEYSVRDMYYDGGKALYVATLGGLVLIDTEEGSYNICPENNHFLDVDVQTVYKDSRGFVWLGHSHGLSIWDPQKNSIRFIDQSQGLAANLVRAIVEDNHHRLWIATGNGVSCLHVVKGGAFSVVNYSVSDGLICNDANVHAILRLRNGNILMGTPKGWECVMPQETIPAAYEADVVLINLSLKSGKASSEVLGDCSPELINQLVLKEEDNSFILAFSALNLVEADKVKYAYRLNGSSSAWMNAEGNKVSFSMLPAGHYTLEVRASSPQGAWSPRIKQLDIRIVPPWWRSWWAYMGYLLVSLAILWQVVRYIRARQRMEAFQLAMEEENEKHRKLSDLKLQFFANISHELRTPLSLIINPLDEFLENHPEHRRGLLELAKQNASYLLELINQLLDFRRLDAKVESLHCRHDNILINLSEIFHSFDLIAQKKNIHYTMDCPHPSVFMDFDYDKVRKITVNILSNAFKFTPPKGSISLHVEVKESYLELSFSDTGCGVDDESKEKIFNRFYQSDRNTFHTGGSGIGLHITSEYVKMHRGTICVKDNHPTGAVFVVTLPLHQNMVEAKTAEVALPDSPVEANRDSNFCILLVDDNHDFLGFLAGSLAKEYKVLKAQNGKQALDRLNQEDVDLVVSDVMMPEMDGLELCRTVKTDIRYSHIPVILLTAKASEEHQLEGLGMGADDYVTKPFNMPVLRARIRNIIDANAKRREAFNQAIRIEPSRITITPLDQHLVEKAIRIVEENIADPGFSVEELASRLNISRSYFYKKLMKITGKKPIEFIRIIRLKRACQLLAESQLQVSEIAYMLGYNSPRIFSRHFKEEFGINPSEYLHRQTEVASK